MAAVSYAEYVATNRFFLQNRSNIPPRIRKVLSSDGKEMLSLLLAEEFVFGK